MKVRWFHFVATTVLFCGSLTAMAVLDEVPIDRTSDFIGCLTHFWEGGEVQEPNLNIFVERLKGGELINPIFKENSPDHSPFDSIPVKQAHFLVQDYVDRAQLGLILINQIEVLKWAQAILKKRIEANEQQKDVFERTSAPEKQMSFNHVNAGEFQMKVDFWRETRAIPVRLTRDFELQSDLVKEWHWVMIMGNNPSSFNPGALRSKFRPYKIKLDISFENWVLEEKEIVYQVDHIMTHVKWFRVQDFIARLNALSASGNSILNEVIKDHHNGDQFRLPTEAEWTIVVQDHGKDSKAPGCENSGEKFNPWIVDGEIFFGFNLGVSEWTNDLWLPNVQSWLAAAFKREKSWLKRFKKVPLEVHVDPAAPDYTGKTDARHVKLTAWETWNARSVGFGSAGCRHSGNSQENPYGSFRLVRMRSQQSE